MSMLENAWTSSATSVSCSLTHPTFFVALNAPEVVIHAALLRNISHSDDTLLPALEKLLALLISLEACTTLIRRAMQTHVPRTTKAGHVLHMLFPAALLHACSGRASATMAHGTACKLRRDIRLIMLVAARRSSHPPNHNDGIIVCTLLAFFIVFSVGCGRALAPLPRALPHAALNIAPPLRPAPTALARAHRRRAPHAPRDAHVAAFWAHERGTGEAVQQDVGMRAAVEGSGGIPDVSAQALNVMAVINTNPIPVSGTSCATLARLTPLAPRPTLTVAGILSMLDDFSISEGRIPLGFLNPQLYSNGIGGPNDIKSGSKPGRGTDGFTHR
ncbi:hypothetical protein BJY52DRAFT_1190728 [Lactarius psammicola]|nr:hypothetical protein BJY52DRAFT_1190728 [Lactarius psammicola]